MKTISSAIAVLGIAAALSAGPAAAQLKAADFYVGATAGQGNARGSCNQLAGCDDSNTALRVLAGYQFNRIFAAEVGYHNFGQARAPGGSYIRSNAWEALVVASWPVMTRLALYGKLGAYRGAQEGGGVFASDKQLNNNFTYGFGAQFSATQNLGLRLEWQNYPDMGGGSVLPKSDINVVSAGAIWRFQ